MSEYERNIAIMEGELCAASDAYFSARQGASHAEVKCFKAGFKRAWELQQAKIDAELAKPDDPIVSTPSATWRKNGEPDPHGTMYDCERAALTMGNLTDDELANAAFLNYDVRPSMQDIIDGKAHSPIAYMTAVKERIRWLSRKLEQAAKHNQDQQEKLTVDQLKQTLGYQNADYNGINAIIWFKRGFEQAEKSYGIGGTK